jgi:transcriptional regulator with XRE-family HTH domain
MAAEAIFANKLAAEREARGLGTAEELARRAGIEPSLYARMEAGEILPSKDEIQRIGDVLGVGRNDLYPLGLATAIGGGGIYEVSSDATQFYREYRDPTRLLVSRDEVAWLERAIEPDGPCDVFVNLSCSTQQVPHLLLNAVAVLRKLKVSFAAGVGAEFCCGGYFKGQGRFDHADRITDRSERPALARQASTHVHFCTQCVNNFTARDNRRAALGGARPPLRHRQLLGFLADRLEELGDEVPWVRSVDRKVAVHSHPTESPVVFETTNDVTRILERVPGVEVVGLLDPTFMHNWCWDPLDLPRRDYPATPEEMQEMRHELAAIVRATGADTVSPQHQECHFVWAPFASVDLAVRHCLSIVAEALGCESPDRAQAAALLGDPDALVEQTRSIWMSWGLTEDKARKIAGRMYKPVTTAKLDGCGRCGPGGCGKEITDIQVLRGIDWESAVRVATRGDGVA